MTKIEAVERLELILAMCYRLDDGDTCEDCGMNCHEAIDMAIEVLEQEPTAEYSSDVISRQAAIETMEKEAQVDGAYDYIDIKTIVDLLNDLPSADRPKWIPVSWHEITEEERAENGYPKDWAVYLDCEMPADEEEILITTRYGTVEKDVCYVDGEFSLDSGYDWIDDVVAWMPLPEPYEEGVEQ